MHRPLLLLATFVLGAASIVAAIASTSLAPLSISKASSESGEVAIVQRYYEAVNHMIAAGDPTLLREIVHPEMIGLDPLATEPAGPEAIERYAAYLHSVVPDARVEPGHIAGDGEQVIAQVRVQRASSTLPLGFALENPAALWPSFEMFRVSGRQIVERQVSWQAPATIQPASAFPFAFDIPAGRILDVTLSTYEPEASGVFVTEDAPAILRPVAEVFSVTLVSTAAESAFVIHPFSDVDQQTRKEVLPGQTLTFRPGEMLVIPAESAVTVRNRGTRAATLLSIALSGPSSDVSEFEGFAKRDQYGITVRSILNLRTDSLGTPSQLSFGTATMMPGSRLTVDPATSLMIVWTVGGHLSVDSGQSACGSFAERAIDPLDIDEHLSNLQLLCPNESEAGMVFNGSSDPADAWIVAVTVTRNGQ